MYFLLLSLNSRTMIIVIKAIWMKERKRRGKRQKWEVKYVKESYFFSDYTRIPFVGNTSQTYIIHTPLYFIRTYFTTYFLSCQNHFWVGMKKKKQMKVSASVAKDLFYIHLFFRWHHHTTNNNSNRQPPWTYLFQSVCTTYAWIVLYVENRKTHEKPSV